MTEYKLKDWEEFEIQPSMNPQYMLEGKVGQLFRKGLLDKSEFDDLMRCIKLYGDLEFRTIRAGKGR